ncbi:M48 family metallopeptidase [Chitinimonas sp. BJB300]|uniref:M48 family metallopeptidase n=1 Tax=Chitinimonas sp. BJB300 TaxID=1559339 RepID=UPI000C107E6A|nr:M48 family metallopeptidase [Chitinimonas sp. BJB300]PHV10259.1 Zn-dependent protease with chaperone function [Chitinimonas sp. BJB300]TSJ87394.1 M48 family metalloprotease [Chitinimonas sp. BJB300]
MESIYPVGPKSVPSDLTKPTLRYKQRAWLAMVSLGLFIILYLSLSGWFAWQAWRLTSSVVKSGEGFGPFVVGLVSAFLAVFMLKALFSVRNTGKIDDIEVTVKEEPQLFAFLFRLADEAGAPRPHRVFLSPRVNAAVFYDMSIFNLFWPSRKNLEIGLALVNVLNLGELKAVLAHEFGHFAQRSMAVGRWVYITQQIAAHIIAKRDALDYFLQQLSRLDFRIAWVGWLLSLIVWAIRSLLETAFRLVLLAQRALSREMEMQADLVAVSLTGSDALIHALNKMEAADDAWDRTLSFANSEFADGRMVKDLFAVHSRVISHMRVVLNATGYGTNPPVPSERPEKHRLFRMEIAQPPKMWSTHPLNHEREENAKRVYLAAPTDQRSAWVLFQNSTKLRESASVHPVRNVADKAQVVPLEQSIKTLDEQFQREYLNRYYRGVYLGRSVVRAAKCLDELYLPIKSVSAEDLAALYPSTLARDLENLRNLEKEKALLASLRNGTMKATDGVIRLRGRQLRRRDLSSAISQVDGEITAIEKKLTHHDQRCRSLHRAAAASLGKEWEDYLVGLAALLHFAGHTEADLFDAHGRFSNEVAIETAAGKVGSNGVDRIVCAANALYVVLEEIYKIRDQVIPDPTVLDRMSVGSWPEALGKFDLPRANRDNINDWLGVIDGWVNAVIGALSSLRQAALGQLLCIETQVAREFRTGVVAASAPVPSRVPNHYATLEPGRERTRQTQLGWRARFQLADGLIASVARFLVAGSIVGAVLGFSSSTGSASLTLYNGLAQSVTVLAGGKTVELGQFSHETFEIEADGEHQIEVRAPSGQLIETYIAKLDGGFAHYVYNIANASPLVEWTESYGNATQVPERPQGAPRWMRATADILFEKPPSSISSKSGGGTRTVLDGFAGHAPGNLLSMLSDEASRKKVILAHARWDRGNSQYVMQWLALANNFPEFQALLAARLQDQPSEVVSLRAEQDAVSGQALSQVCARHSKEAQRQPDSGDWQYLAVRCLANDVARDKAFIESEQRWPNNGWFAMAAAYVHAGRGHWHASERSFTNALRQQGPVLDNASIEIARLRRMQGTGDFDELAMDSNALRYLMDTESGQNMGNGPLTAYAALGKGDLKEAIERASAQQRLGDRVLRLVAGSEGADPKWVQQALAMPKDRGLDFNTAWVMLALALRNKVDSSEYRQLLLSADQYDSRGLLAVADSLARGASQEVAEAHMVGLSPSVRGSAYGIGVILLGRRAPPHWRESAKRLLFAAERPYLG